MTTIRIRDLTSGDAHSLPASTPAILRPRDSSNALRSDEVDDEEETLGSIVERLRSTCASSIEAFVRSDDSDERGGVLWWRSEVRSDVVTAVRDRRTSAE